MEPLDEHIKKLNQAYEEMRPTSERSLQKIRQQIKEMQAMLSSIEDALKDLPKMKGG